MESFVKAGGRWKRRPLGWMWSVSYKDAMKREAIISHDEATIRELRKSPEFAAEYLRAALEDADEPRVLLITLRRIAKARGGIAKVAKAGAPPLAGFARSGNFSVGRPTPYFLIADG